MTKMKISKDVVVLRPVQLKTKSGLQGVETGRNAPEIGEVIGFGEGTPPVKIAVGDTVVYRKYVDNKVYIPQEGEELNFVDFKEIVANLGKQ
jgi:co-chaperonin GroES (HSP10)